MTRTVKVGVVIAAALGAGWWAYRRDLRRAASAMRRGRSVLDTPAGPVEYAQVGAGPALLSIHGAGGGYDQGLANAAALVGDGYRVIAPSRFGYLGAPVPPDASPAAQADTLINLLSGLQVTKAIVLGVSAGARSAVELALRSPERVAALVLVVPGTYAPTSPVSVAPGRGNRLVLWLVGHGADFAWWLVEKIAPRMLIRFLGVRPALMDTATAAERTGVMRLVRSIQPLSRRVAGVEVDSAPDLRALPLERIGAPTLIVSAEDDLFNTLPAAAFAARRIPGARLVVYPTGGHLLLGRDQEVRAEVRAFLADALALPPTA